MYPLSDDQITFISNDISRKGIVTDDLRENLVDHICCIIENELEESGDFHSFYSSCIKRFYKTNLQELEEETKALLMFKHYYTMKKVMLYSGIASAIMMTAGIIFKFLHLAGASALLVTAAAMISFLFLPLMFILKLKENTSLRDRILIGLAAVAAICLVLSPIFKVMHWRGANMLGLVSIVILIGLFLPFYLFTGIRKAETRLNTILSSVLMVIAVALLLVLFRSPHSTHMQEMRATAVLVRSEMIYQNERRLLKESVAEEQLRIASQPIDQLCEELKTLIIEDQTGSKTLSPSLLTNDQLIHDQLVENYFRNDSNVKKLQKLRSLAESYNKLVENRPLMMPIPIDYTLLDQKEDKVSKALDDLMHIQIIVLQNQRIDGSTRSAMNQ